MSSPGHKNGVRRKRRYTRTTAIGRVLRSLAKVDKILGLIRGRYESWKQTDGKAVEAGTFHRFGEYVKEAVEKVGKATAEVEHLDTKGWSPPKKSLVVVFEEGELVKISDKYRSKYLGVYAVSVIDELEVSKILPTGEIAVKHGSRSPFIVAKSHLSRRTV